MKEACDLAEINIQKGGDPFGCVITDSNENFCLIFSFRSV